MVRLFILILLSSIKYIIPNKIVPILRKTELDIVHSSTKNAPQMPAKCPMHNIIMNHRVAASGRKIEQAKRINKQENESPTLTIWYHGSKILPTAEFVEKRDQPVSVNTEYQRFKQIQSIQPQFSHFDSPCSDYFFRFSYYAFACYCFLGFLSRNKHL